MNRRLNTWCPLPQKKEAQIFAHLVTFFTELETRVLMYDDVPTVTVRYQKLKRSKYGKSKKGGKMLRKFK